MIVLLYGYSPWGKTLPKFRAERKISTQLCFYPTFVALSIKNPANAFVTAARSRPPIHGSPHPGINYRHPMRIWDVPVLCVTFEADRHRKSVCGLLGFD